MTEVTQQIIQQEIGHTPVRQISQPGPAKTSEDNEINSNHSNNEEPHRVKRKKRRHKRTKPHRDPQQIKELRLQRLNMKREGQWNSRFINDTIPEMFISKAKKKKSEPIRRTKSPIQTVYLDKDLPRNKLPNIMRVSDKEEISKNTQKSFNIRTVGGKKEPFRRGKKLKKSQDHSIESKLPIKVEQLHVDKVLIKPKQTSQQKLKAKLEEKTKIHPINPQYKSLLLDLIQCSSAKPTKELRILLQNQINSIDSKKNPYARIDNMIKERKQMLKEITETGEKTTLGAYLGFQIASIGLIEQILKFKAKWEEQFSKMGINKKVEYNYQGTNYLLAMNEQVKELNPIEVDPFLITRTNRLQELVGNALKEQEKLERKQMLLKIRACELLLIEEELSS